VLKRKQSYWKYLAACLLLGAALAAGAAGCGPAAGPGQAPPAQGEKEGQALQPLPEKTAEILGIKVTAGGGTVRGGMIHRISFDLGPGAVDYTPAAAMFSPEGRWVAFRGVQENPDGRTAGLWAMALDGSGGRLLARSGENELTGDTLVLQLLGWTADSQVVFARQGTQTDGAHRGQRGISLQAVAPEQGEAREFAWLPVPEGMVRQIQYLPGADCVFVQAARALWRVDVADGKKTLLKENTPSYDGFFYPRVSLAGDSCVYELWEPDRKGIFLLDLKSGQERALALNGENWNFQPRYSPDGAYLAYYAAPLKPGQKTGQYAGDYAIVPAEDGPAPAAEAVEVVRPDGQKVARLTVPGALAANFCWGVDGRRLAFAAGKVKSNPAGQDGFQGEVALEWQSLWVADLQGKMTKVADLPPEAKYIIPLSVSPDGGQVYYVVSSGERSALWAAREGEDPAEVVAGPENWDDFFSAAGGLDGFFLVRGEDGRAEVYGVADGRAVQITADGGDKTVLGVSGGRLAYLQGDRFGGRSRLVVLSCE
jgi:Tol biopolymer transport system component